MIKTNHRVRVQRVHREGAFYLELKFAYNAKVIHIIKGMYGRWNPEEMVWLLEDHPDTLEVLFKRLVAYTFVDYRHINARLGPRAKEILANRRSGTKHPTKDKAAPEAKVFPLVPPSYMLQLKSRKYSQSTMKTYPAYFSRFLQFIAPVRANDVEDHHIKTYLVHLSERHNVADSTYNQHINAIKFYYEHVLKQQRKVYWIERPRKVKRLPEVLSESDVAKLIASTNNLKHQVIVALLYSAGLRRDELVNLRIRDIDLERLQVFVRGGKGKKDRVSIISKRMAQGIRMYLSSYKPNYWLFEGPHRKRYSGGSVGVIVKNAAKRAGIKKCTPHMLRHSFATHLMDHGTDTRIIQRLLGHNRLETTAVYTHVSTHDFQKIKNPLDHLFDQSSGFTERLDKRHD